MSMRVNIFNCVFLKMDIVLGVLTLVCLCFSAAHSWHLREVRQVRNVNSNQKRIVCYFGSWAEGRDGDSKFTSDDIPGDLCTHVIYAFASLDKNIGIIPLDNNRDVEQGGYDKFITIKEKNPDVKLMLSIGGIAEGPARFSRIAADPMLRSNFVKKGKDFLRQFNFDGIDLAWQWPGLAEGSSASDKDNYLLLVKEMREELQDEFVISIAVPFLEYLIHRGFHLHQLSQYVDFMNVITYNFHEATEAEVNHVAPLYYIPEDTDDTKQLNVDSTIRTYLSLGMDPSKLNLGIPLYGISFILEDASQTDIGSKTEDQGPGHEDRGGEDIYNKYCKKIVDDGWTVKHVNKSAVGPYAFKDKIWLAYDDEDMVRTKAKYAVEKKLGGLVFWSVDIDDFKAICNSRSFPLINGAKDEFFRQNPPVKQQTTKKPKIKPTNPPEINQPSNSQSSDEDDEPLVNDDAFSPKEAPRSITVLNAEPKEIDQTNKPYKVKKFKSSLIDRIDEDRFPERFPENKGDKVFHNNRDITFQNIQVLINYH